MKFLILSIGLVCYIAGLFFLFKDDEQSKKSVWLILIGGLLIIANCFYLWYRVTNKIEVGSIVVGTIFVSVLIVYAILYHTEFHNKGEWGVASFILIGMTLFITFWGRLPSVTLDNDVIKMSGSFGRTFNISDIQS